MAISRDQLQSLTGICESLGQESDAVFTRIQDAMKEIPDDRLRVYQTIEFLNRRLDDIMWLRARAIVGMAGAHKTFGSPGMSEMLRAMDARASRARKMVSLVETDSDDEQTVDKPADAEPAGAESTWPEKLSPDTSVGSSQSEATRIS